MKSWMSVAFMFVLAVAVAWPLAQAEEKKKKNKKSKQPGQVASVLKKLDEAGLSGEQKEQLKEVVEKYSAKLKELTEKLGDGQQAANEARKAAAADGKKGKDLQEAIVASLTDEQKEAWTALQAANQEFRGEVAKLLTDEQREKAGLARGKKKKDKAGA